MCYTVGGILLLVYCFRKKQYTDSSTVEEEEGLLGSPTKCSFVLNVKGHVSLLAIIIYFGFVTSLICQIFSSCLEGQTDYRPQSFTCYGLSFITAALSVAYTNKTTVSNSVIASIMLIFGFIINGVLFPVGCGVNAGWSTQNNWAMVPISGIFLGSGAGLLTCETFTLVARAWVGSEYRYVPIIVSQSAWTILIGLCPAATSYHNFFILTSVLTVLYTLFAIYLHTTSQPIDRASKYAYMPVLPSYTQATYRRDTSYLQSTVTESEYYQ